MHEQSAVPEAKVVTVTPLQIEAGSFQLPRANRHRVLIHASAATRSYCGQAGRYFVRRAGDIDLVPAGEEGGFEAETRFNTLELGLSSALIENVATELGSGRLGRLETRHLLRDERIEHLARALENDFRMGSPSGSLFADSIGVALAVRLLELKEKGPERSSRLSDLQLKRVLDFIEAQIQTPLSLDTLSKVAGVSNSHLRTWFKAATGLTVHRYVLRRRIEKARLLLLSGDSSISEVAHLTGFAHQSHLAHWMRRELGETPRSLKRSRS
ncbi:helix-turn-helix transcriptional regulator [Rhizobium tropici]|uniref:Helix-turn-helix transcriptional regulator n=1 Tax=Rhizobium tropici TaxID=398 RepID=A0A5B0WFT5_RHITR|nr:AraC family transcriptional regulator [Rhizobium tropici]KAA1184719.1 helix-turn-helix transcriptional regulator [Rhizobium tropici]